MGQFTVMPDLDKQPADTAGHQGHAGGADADIESSNVLEDLLLQAEIFVQYGMKPRAVERAQRIARQFPGAERNNGRLAALYASVEFSPEGASASAPAAAEELPDDAIVDVTRISEITRNILRQPSVRALLSTAVNEIGRSWRISRCVAGLCSPGRPPTIAVEYFAPGLPQSDVKSIVLVLTTMAQATAGGEAVAVEDVAISKALAGLASAQKALDLRSLLALPLIEAGQPIGVMVLEQCERKRRWRSNEVNVLKSLVEQVVVTAEHVRLRSMVRSLALSDEGSGLLNRSAYLDCLLAECTRARKQNTPLTVMLLQFGAAQAAPGQAARPGVRRPDEYLANFMQEAGKALGGRIRQNDISVRYDTNTVAMILPDTRGGDGLAVVDKVRRAVAGIRAEGDTPAMAVGLAEAIVEESMDEVDSVTELINRAEAALEAAQREGAAIVKLVPQPGAEPPEASAIRN